MIVKEQKKLEFVNVCGCLIDYEELEKAILWYRDKPVTRLKKIYLHGSYPAVSVVDWSTIKNRIYENSELLEE